MATIPMLNLNGTAKGDLLGGLWEVLQRLRDARQSMAEHSPHGRDYQLKRGSYEKAVAEYHKNDQIITDLIAYYTEIWHGIEKQQWGGREEQISGIVDHLLVERTLRSGQPACECPGCSFCGSGGCNHPAAERHGGKLLCWQCGEKTGKPGRALPGID